VVWVYRNLVMRGLQITELKQLFGSDDAFVAYGFEKFHHDDLSLDVDGKQTARSPVIQLKPAAKWIHCRHFSYFVTAENCFSHEFLGGR